MIFEPTVEEELILSEALEFAEDLASGRNEPLRFYVKGLKKTYYEQKKKLLWGGDGGGKGPSTKCSLAGL